MTKFCLNPACKNPQNPDLNNFCHGCRANLAESTQSYRFEYYRVTKLLGKGGFGRTYLAEFLRRYHEPRVIKTLLISENEQTQQKVKELFAREAEQLYHLDHPQIPKLYEYFEKDNNLYLVQEFIDGMTLGEEFEQQGTFPAEKIQTILEELLPVLAYIEEQNLLHRDIKPANIMRRRSDGLLMLIDFGAARVKTARDPSILTAIYTPGYAAIEHMRGRPVKASDIYSLGVTCIRLLTGCFPSYTSDLIYDDRENRWCWKEYLQQKNLKVNEPLAAILDKIVAHSLRDRYPDAQAVLEDLLNPSSLSFPSPRVLETEQKPTVPSTIRITPPTEVETGQNPTVPLIPTVSSPTGLKSSQRVGWLAGVAALVTGVVGIGGYLLINQPEKISQNSPDSTVRSLNNNTDNNGQELIEPEEKHQREQEAETTRSSLISKSTGVDYMQLRNLLVAGKWKEADRETTRAMLQAAKRENEGWLRNEDLNNFACEDLRLIDQFWRESSQGKFGFRVQKEIYQNLGGTREYNYEVWKNFGDQVGWRQGGSWLNYSDLTFNFNASRGHLPNDFYKIEVLEEIEVDIGYGFKSFAGGILFLFFSRAANCNL